MQKDLSTFELTLRNDKRKQYDRIALFIIIINLILFTYSAFYKSQLAAGLGAGLSIGVIGREIFKFGSTKNKLGGQVVGILTWLAMQQWWMAIVCTLVAALYLISKRRLTVIFQSGQMTYPSFPKKEIAWSELSNIVLKDDLLTIDFKNNRIVQQMIEKTAEPIDEREFNDFCREQLRSAKPA